MGNPPYSGISANINDWTEKLLKTNLDGAQSYYEIDGEKLDDKTSLSSVIREKNVGQTISLKILHRGTEKTVSVTLEAAKDN